MAVLTTSCGLFVQNLLFISPWLLFLIIILALISLIMTALVLWKTARQKKVGWFIFFFLVHTIIIEAIYLYITRKEKTKATKRKGK